MRVLRVDELRWRRAATEIEPRVAAAWWDRRGEVQARVVGPAHGLDPARIEPVAHDERRAGAGRGREGRDPRVDDRAFAVEKFRELAERRQERPRDVATRGEQREHRARRVRDLAGPQAIVAAAELRDRAGARPHAELVRSKSERS